jgi:hypothetical protein
LILRHWQISKGWLRYRLLPQTPRTKLESQGRKPIKKHDAPAPTLGRQMSLIFEPQKLEGMTETERAKATTTLAQILMQAAGLVVEEFDDDRR